MIQNENPQKPRSTVKTIIFIGLILLIVLNFPTVINGIKNIYGVIFPLVLGAAIAYVVDILVKGYEKIYFPKSSHPQIIKTRRGICILLSIATIFLILLFFLHILIPQVVETMSLLSAALPAMYNNIMAWVNQYADEIPLLQEKIAELNMDGASVFKRSLQLLGNWGWGTVSFMGTVFGEILSFVLSLIFAIYILFGKADLIREFNKLSRAYLRAGRREKLYDGLKTADETFSNYIVGQCKDAVILGILCTLGMLILRFPYATIIGPVIGLSALIPMVGAYLGAAVGFLLIVMVNPIKAVLFILFIVILQQIEGNLIYPKVVGESIGLPGIWVFAAVTVGGGLFGVVGILLGVPIAATAYKLVRKSVDERLN